MSLLAFALPGLPPQLVSFLPFLLIIVVFYFLLIRPNQNKQKHWQEMLNNLKPGDKVTTTGAFAAPSLRCARTSSSSDCLQTT